MTSKSLRILAGITVFALGGVAWSLWSEQSTLAGTSQRAEILFPALAEQGAQIETLEVVAPNYELRAVRKGDEWLAASKGDYPIRASLARDVVAALAKLRLREPKTSLPEWYGRISVEDPASEGATSKLVRLTTSGSPEPLEVIVGRRSASIGADPAGGTFVRRPDEQQAWLSQGSIMLPDLLGDWFEQVVHVPGTEVQRITISEGGEVVFDAEKKDGDTSYTLVSVASEYGSEGNFANDSGVKRVAQGIVSVSFTDVRPAGDVQFPEDSRVVRFQTKSGATIEARLGELDGATWVSYSATAEPGTAGAELADAVNRRGKGWAFQVDSNRLAAVETEVADLLQTEAEAQSPVMPQGNFPGAGQILPGLPGAGSQMPPGLPPELQTLIQQQQQQLQQQQPPN